MANFIEADYAVQANKPELNLLRDPEIPLKAQYHGSEINNHNKIVGAMTKMLWAGFIVLAIGIFFMYKGNLDSGKITLVCGVVIEFITGGVFAMAEFSSKSKQEYYNKLSREEEQKRLLNEINKCSNEKAREKLLEKMVDNYCGK